MKQFLPVALSLLIVACAPPKPGTDAHQQQLVEEARANFYAMKEQERLARGGAPRASEDARNQQPQRTAKVRLKPFAPAAAPANDTAYENSKPAPVAKVKPVATPAPKVAAVSKPAPVAKAPKATPAPVAKAPKPAPKPVANKPAPAPKKFSWFANSTPKPAAEQKPAAKPNAKLAQKPVAKPTPKPAPKLVAKPTPAPKPVAKTTPAPTPKAKSPAKTKKPGDTVYIYDLQQPQSQEPNTRRYRSYKAKYAASLGKKPENLNRKELEWVRTHYRE